MTFIDGAVITESILLAFSWFLFLWEKPRSFMDFLKIISIFAGLWMVDFLIRLAFIWAVISRGFVTRAFDVLLMYLLYSLVGLLFLRVFASYKKLTRILITAMMFASVCALNSMGGQLSYLIGNSVGGGIYEGLARCAISVFLIPLALYLKGLKFDEYPFVPIQGQVMLFVGDLVLVVLSIFEGSPRYKDTFTFILFFIAFSGVYLMMLSEINALSDMCKEHMVLMRLQAEKQRNAGERELVQATEDSIHTLRSLRHDLKNQYGYMQMLLAEKRYDEMGDYFKEMTEHLPEPLQYVDCGNKSMNTLLNMMFIKARRQNVTIEHQLVVPPVLPFSDEDLCSLVSNLLDNAIEECVRLQKKGKKEVSASIDIHPIGSYLIIQCSNTTDRKEIRAKNGGLITTKSDDSIHGYGTYIVSKISQKYNGLTDYRLESGKFVAKVMLDIMTGEKEHD